ncbi:hypothetical protein VC83_00682 [Pseudogymnoascus destructans]|uniref:Myb-like DNA-binding domain-containing protein n=2 Tax=Pseudogymnoascus destructans TaxID=655981 RepID=L8FYG9_PSED2|nr:uncharacterized protein VC83_00682 [Pseudogymnoascus destructans]ELR04741.1 hypothetical protein GMDG_06970 [Pseudogymnoascus destructans 20631-21]OAF62793.1 hypothetical protein VC83_00682 [Pseudogymnoascus destructans]
MSGQPPSSPAQPGATRVPTPLECNFLVAIVKNSDGVTNIDWDAVASEAGYNNAATARVRFGQVKKALGWSVRTIGLKTSPIKSPTKVEKKPAKPRARKPKALTKKQQEALAQAVDDVSNGHKQEDDANGHKEEYGNGYKQEHEVIKTEDVDEDADTAVEEEYASANDCA